MPFLFKQTLIFESAGHGWTENLYFQMASDDVLAARAFIGDNKNKRRPLLGAQGQIKGERIALVQDDAGNKVTRVGFLDQFSLPGTAAQPSEDTGTSLEVMWSDSFNRYKKITYLGGAWAALFPFANAYTPAVGNWVSFFNQWVASCITLGLGWRRRTLTATGSITNYTSNAQTGITTYTVKSGASLFPALNQPYTVGVEFFGQRSPLDGMQVVIPTDELAPVPPATTWTTTVSTAGSRPAKAFTTQGFMKIFGSTFVTPKTPNGTGGTGSIVGMKPVNRKRGRPLLVSRGRAPVRVRF